MRIAAISGGGAAGIRVLAELAKRETEGLVYDAFTGESIGAAIALACSRLGARAAYAMWMSEIDDSRIYKGGGWLAERAAALKLRRSVYDMSPALRFLEDLAQEPVKAPHVCTASDLEKGEFLQVRCDKLLPWEAASWTYRSCLIPLVHGADLDRFADGGILATAPLDPAIRLGADEIDVFLCSPVVPGSAKTPSWTEQVLRSIELMRRRTLQTDWDLAERVNASPREGERRIAITVTAPARALPASLMDFSRTANAARLDVPMVTMNHDEARRAWEWRRTMPPMWISRP